MKWLECLTVGIILLLKLDVIQCFYIDGRRGLTMRWKEERNLNMKGLGSKGSPELFVCESCGAEHIKWMGRCSNCKEWNTIKAFKPSRLVSSINPRALHSPVSSAATSSTGKWLNLENGMKDLMPLSSISDIDGSNRLEIFSPELNRVLGGGLVPGSVVLLTGEPGIGKSTLLLQLAASVGKVAGKVIYLSGEENPQQIAMRAKRLGVDRDSIYLICEMDIDQVFSKLAAMDTPPSLLIVDSIQTISTETSAGNVGSVSQIRESTGRIIQYAKTFQIPAILIGHVTKSGDVAGPKVLEHMVDTVLSLEGSDKFDYRIIRCEKNRFGSVSEVGVFTMGEVGMVDVLNPSELFLTEGVLKVPQEGATVVIAVEGSRCLLAEVQCLVGTTHSNSNVKMSSKRASDGFPIQRLLLLLAVIEKRLRLTLWNRDVYLNIVGGLSINEPSADLAVAVAIVSSLLSIPVTPATAFIGEIGLGGEIRGAKRIEQRILEAIKLGFKRIVLPKSALKSSTLETIRQKISSITGNLEHYEILPCYNLQDAVEKGLLLHGKTLEQIKSGMRKKSQRLTARSYEEQTQEEGEDESEGFTMNDFT